MTERSASDSIIAMCLSLSGCGDGVLTLQLQSSGASVTAVDASEPMIHAARDNGITDAHVIDGHRLDEKMPEWEGAFDAVFSNAALHWMKSDPAKVVRNVRGLLKKGGRFVAEFGGYGNIQCIVDAREPVRGRDGVTRCHAALSVVQ